MCWLRVKPREGKKDLEREKSELTLSAKHSSSRGTSIFNATFDSSSRYRVQLVHPLPLLPRPDPLAPEYEPTRPGAGRIPLRCSKD